MAKVKKDLHLALEAYGVGRDMPVTQEERDCLTWLRIRIHLLFFFDNVRFSWNRLCKAMEDLESAERVAQGCM